jgi:hypothetical protein
MVATIPTTTGGVPMNVIPYIDSDPITARGTPMARPKIGDSIVDVIGGTPMVSQFIILMFLQEHCVRYIFHCRIQFFHLINLLYFSSSDQVRSSGCGLPRQHPLEA